MKNNGINLCRIIDTMAAAVAGLTTIFAVVSITAVFFAACWQTQQAEITSELLSFRDAKGRQRPVVTRSD